MADPTSDLVCPVDRDGVRAILRPRNELDITTSPELKDLGASLVAEGVIYLALDLSGVPFIDSTGLGAMVVILKRARDRNGNVCLFSANEQIRSLLGMTGLDAVFHLEPDENAALKYLRDREDASIGGKG